LTLLGLDLSTRTARVVVLDERGAELTRAADDDAATAIRAALQGRTVDRAGVAVSELADGASGGIPGAVASALGSLTPHTLLHGAAVALGEQWTGAARDATHVVALSAADTIDAGIVVDGRLFGGAHGLAGAARWLALNPVEREDYRKFGCLEAEVGNPGIVRRLVWRIKSGDRSRALEFANHNLAAITAEHVFDAARAGDGVAISVVRDTAKYIGMAVANLVAIVDPQIVVLGGGIAEAGDLLLEPTRLELSRRISPASNQHVRVMPAALGDAAAAVGAARAALLAAR
jgi:predicted NBD/HSP70 family sugar kinase